MSREAWGSLRNSVCLIAVLLFLWLVMGCSHKEKIWVGPTGPETVQPAARSAKPSVSANLQNREEIVAVRTQLLALFAQLQHISGGEYYAGLENDLEAIWIQIGELGYHLKILSGGMHDTDNWRKALFLAVVLLDKDGNHIPGKFWVRMSRAVSGRKLDFQAGELVEADIVEGSIYYYNDLKLADPRTVSGQYIVQAPKDPEREIIIREWRVPINPVRSQSATLYLPINGDGYMVEGVTFKG